METLLLYLLKSAGILGIFYLSYHFLLKNETFFRTNRHFLLTGILTSIFLPLMVFTKYVVVEQEPFNPLWLQADASATNTIAEATEPFNWLRVLYWIYAVIMLILTIKFIIQLVSLFSLISTNGFKKVDGFKLVETQANISPFSFFNYIVYNPVKYNQTDLNIILNHEKAHGKQLHSIDILIAHLLIITQWFNPFAWLYKKSIQQNLEFMADQIAVTKVNCSKHYQHTLLKASLKPQYASITNNFYNSLIKKRIVMLNQSKSNIKNSWKYFVILPSLALFLMSFNVKTVEVVKVTESPKSNLDSMFFSDESQPENETKTEHKASAPVISKQQNKNTSIQENIKIKIDKNTSDADFESIKNELKKEGIDFSITNVKRNSNNEIKGLQVTFKDSNGNSGNYSLNGEEPINTFYFVKDKNSIGFASEAKSPIEMISEERKAREIARAKRMEREEKREAMLLKRKEDIEKREKVVDERKEEIEIRIKEAKEKHKERMETAKKNYEVFIYEAEKTDDTTKKSDTIYIDKNKYSNNKAIYIVDGKEIDLKDLNRINTTQITQVKVLKGDKAIVAYGDRGKDGVIEIITKEQEGPWKIEYGINATEFTDDESVFNDGNFSFHIQESDESKSTYFKNHLPPNSKTTVINKNTNDKFLKAVKNILLEEGIDFKYSKLKRNNQDLITSIKISLTDENGNKASATWKENENGIPNILVGKVKGRLIATSNY